MVNRVMCEQRRLRGNPEKSLLSVTDLSQLDFHKIMGMAARMKSSPNDEFMDAVTKHKKIALIFQKTSTRTKESFLTGAYELGVMASYIDWNTSNFMLSELEDEIKVLSQWYDIIMTRVYDHNDLLTMKKYSEVPIINGLCDRYHPCQALADCKPYENALVTT
jgi:ornithine carbamoyltransferase